ncbi:MAG: hypothetical protein J0L93_11010 [Deltaproteobacteria bacterium]|nr:hypothetical protein [Deltaproteobacteria bacterium]
MLSYTALYALFAVASIALFNALILLSRYITQTKQPPADEDFEKLFNERNQLQNQFEQEHQEALTLQAKVQKLETELQKAEESLKVKIQEIENLNKPPAPAAAPAPTEAKAS